MKFSLSTTFILLAFSHAAAIASANPLAANQECSPAEATKTVTVTAGAVTQTITVSAGAASTSVASGNNNNNNNNNNNSGGSKGNNNNGNNGGNNNNGAGNNNNNGGNKNLGNNNGGKNNAGNNNAGNNNAGNNSNNGGNNGAANNSNNNGNNNGGNTNNNGNNNAGNNNGNNNAGNNNGNNGGNNGNANGGNNNGNDGAQTSLQLDPSVIGPNLALDGLAGNGSTAGQAPSATSKNNFINFCLGKQITNGLQFKDDTSSCNPVPMGDIPAKSTMPQCKFSSPANFGTIKPNTAFTVSLGINGMQTGTFVNPNTNYFAAPQALNGQGQIIGHSHIVIQLIPSLTDTTVADPEKFAFFQGLNAPAQNGQLSVDVTKGLPEGVYRIASINTAGNHQPVLVPVAQHGSMDDMIYITVSDKGAAANATGADAAANATATDAAANSAANATATDAGKDVNAAATGGGKDANAAATGGGKDANAAATSAGKAAPTDPAKATGTAKGANTPPTAAGKDAGAAAPAKDAKQTEAAKNDKKGANAGPSDGAKDVKATDAAKDANGAKDDKKGGKRRRFATSRNA